MSLGGDVIGAFGSNVVKAIDGASIDTAATANTIVKRDATGDIHANHFVGLLTGNLAGDVTGPAAATVVALVGGSTASAVHTAVISAVTALTGDVSATGPGSVAATVNSVGTSSAANVHAAELLANAATSSPTVSTIVKRDSSGNFKTNNVLTNYTTRVASSGGTTTLTVSDSFHQNFTGTTLTHNVKLPNATTLLQGHKFFIHNTINPGNLVVKDNGGTTLYTLNNQSTLGTAFQFELLDNSTSNGTWYRYPIGGNAVSVAGTLIERDSTANAYVNNMSASAYFVGAIGGGSNLFFDTDGVMLRAGGGVTQFGCYKYGPFQTGLPVILTGTTSEVILNGDVISPLVGVKIRAASDNGTTDSKVFASYQTSGGGTVFTETWAMASDGKQMPVINDQARGASDPVTCDGPFGVVSLSAGWTSLTVINASVSMPSLINVWNQSAAPDATTKAWSVDYAHGAGTFTIVLDAALTSDATFAFEVIG